MDAHHSSLHLIVGVFSPLQLSLTVNASVSPMQPFRQLKPFLGSQSPSKCVDFIFMVTPSVIHFDPTWIPLSFLSVLKKTMKCVLVFTTWRLLRFLDPRNFNDFYATTF